MGWRLSLHDMFLNCFHASTVSIMHIMCTPEKQHGNLRTVISKTTSPCESRSIFRFHMSFHIRSDLLCRLGSIPSTVKHGSSFANKPDTIVILVVADWHMWGLCSYIPESIYMKSCIPSQQKVASFKVYLTDILEWIYIPTYTYFKVTQLGQDTWNSQDLLRF